MDVGECDDNNKFKQIEAINKQNVLKHWRTI